MSLHNALAALGNLLEVAVKENDQLPNQYTKGVVDGVARAYQTVVKEIDQQRQPPQPQQQDDPYFTNPPVNPQTGQMIKHGDRVLNQPTGVSSHEETLENLLAQISGDTAYLRLIVERFYNAVVHNAHPESNVELEDFEEETNKSETYTTLPARSNWNTTFGEKMQDLDKNQKSAFAVDPEVYEDLVEETKARVEAFHEPPADEEYVDIDTGEKVRKRTIGTVRVDDDDEEPPARSFEEWAERQESKSPRNEYVAEEDRHGLQDLRPGQVD